MAGTARTKLSKSSSTLQHNSPAPMEVSPVMYLIITALYSIGMKILDMFQHFQDSFDVLGNAKSLALGVQLQDKLTESLGDNLAAFCKHLKDYWCSSLYKELLLMLAAMYHQLCSEHRTMFLMVGGIGLRELKFPTSLDELFLEYTVITTSIKTVPQKNPHKCSMSPPTKEAEVIAMAPKKESIPEEPVIVKVEKGAAPWAFKPKVKQLQASKGAAAASVPNNDGPPAVSSSSKGKAKALPTATDEEDEVDKADEPEDVYDITKIPALSIQEWKLTKKPKFLDCILKYFGSAQALINALSMFSLFLTLNLCSSSLISHC
ncbi:hypothetical protein Moror_15520 [Moniliophthora roreri MCA 2997]|uniref:Uncharacterized protein n=1 Tax=Moniliophthora roreri (strain MCA 2997) TaxID=1381753 RepID=V2WKD9_MONRO|nr:hypothetical protein Moror_15520 [Moniliophthora roreri MCA 2997]